MNKARGFTLIELMIAITLAMVVTIGLLSMFMGTRGASQATTGIAALTDGGRFALNVLQYGARSAGYMACNTAQRQTSLLNPGTSPLPYTYVEAIGGFEAVGTSPTAGAYTLATAPVTPDASAGDWVAGTDPVDYTGGLDPVLVPKVVQGNDVLVVRASAANSQPVFVTNIAAGASTFQMNSGSGITGNPIAVISDCAKSVVFRIGSVSTSGAISTVSFGLGGGTPGNNAASFPVTFAIGAQVTAVDTVAYYIGKGADGDGALFSYDAISGGGEIVPDIEAMQILYGLDNTQSQTAGIYVTADQVNNFNNVMSIKVAVLAASLPNAVKPPTTALTYNMLGTIVTAPIDSRSRQVFEMTIALRNALN